jgi:hypothetical protein
VNVSFDLLNTLVARRVIYCTRQRCDLLVTDARLRHVVVDNVDCRRLAWCECKSGRCCSQLSLGLRGPRCWRPRLGSSDSDKARTGQLVLRCYSIAKVAQRIPKCSQLSSFDASATTRSTYTSHVLYHTLQRMIPMRCLPLYSVR